MKVLIVGHMGQIGRALARELKAFGAEVHGCDLRAGMDCRDMFTINKIAYDLVINAAAVDPTIPRGAGQMSVDAQFFDWVGRTEQPKVIYFSGADAYPQHLQQEPSRLRESDLSLVEPASPGTGEGWAKVLGEILASEVNVQSASKVQVWRPFEVYGEGGRGIFHQVAEKVRRREDPFVLSGCGQVLDFIHAQDAVQAVMRAIERDLHFFPAVNLCTGEPTAVDELALAMFEHVKWEPKTFSCDWQDSTFFRCGDPTLLRTIFIPRVDLATGIARELT